MAPRRNQQEGLDGAAIERHDATTTRCCTPGDCLRGGALIAIDDLRDAVKVTCNNEHCSAGPFMHRECFEAWEQTVLTYLKSCGRARSWSERQRHQNLWTKKGYDLAFKACGCRCGRGHLKKDLDWTPPPWPAGLRADDEAAKKKKRRHKQNSRPALAVSAHHLPPNPAVAATNAASDLTRGRAGSLSSSNGSSSPPASASSISPVHSGSVAAVLANKKKSKFDFFSDRSNVNGNGIFSRRQDFSSFNALPRHKLNSYHIKMEDEGNHGNDDTRCFILSTLAANHMCRVSCILCTAPMPVFDRYPLIDGTFFLSPLQHSKACIETKLEGRTQFLTAVCMGCLEGWAPGTRLLCRFCHTPWDGSSLVLGTMYSYDIFAAMPCCTERLKCSSCQTALLMPHQRLNFFSDYSHRVACPRCSVQDFHFVKPLSFCYSREWP